MHCLNENIFGEEPETPVDIEVFTKASLIIMTAISILILFDIAHCTYHGCKLRWRQITPDIKINHWEAGGGNFRCVYVKLSLS